MSQETTGSRLVSRQRQGLLAKMTDRTRELAKAGEDLVNKSSRGIILSRYGLGELARRAMENQAEYGSNAANQLAEYWGIPSGASLLYKFINFSKAFSRDFVAAWSAKAMPNGSTLELAHWLKLAELREPAQVSELLNACISRGMSAAQLGFEIRGSGAAKKNTRIGLRKPKLPTSTMQALQKTVEVCTTVSNYLPLMQEEFRQLLENEPPSKMDQRLETALQESLDTLQQAEDRARATREALEQRLAFVQELKRLNAKKKK